MQRHLLLLLVIKLLCLMAWWVGRIVVGAAEGKCAVVGLLRRSTADSWPDRAYVADLLVLEENNSAVDHDHYASSTLAFTSVGRTRFGRQEVEERVQTCWSQCYHILRGPAREA
jgi:hypothetical protein